MPTDPKLLLFWAKLGGETWPEKYHPVLCHLIDVGWVAHRLWEKLCSEIEDRESTTTTVEGSWMPNNDEELVVAAASGCRDSFRLLYQRYYARVYGFVAGVLIRANGLCGQDNAEDLTQDCFVAAWEQLRSLRDASRFRSWLFAIAHNEAKTFITRHPMARLAHDCDAASDSDAPDESLNREERDAALIAAIAELPEVYRDAVLDRMEAFRSRNKRNWSGTDRSRLCRAYEHLRKLLGPDFASS